MEKVTKTGTAKRSFWIAFAFYAFIAFEFMYMSSPFAVYFYSAYLPELNFLNDSQNFAWLGRFFFPHIAVDTTSTIVNLHNVVGATLALGGFIAFCVGAFQVYRNKLFKLGPVTGGVYDVIRHPQYTAFAVCGLGLLLMWPRFLAVAAFVVLLFAYFLLANAEEAECEAKFGQSYLEYKARTAMFIPVRAPSWWPSLPKAGASRAVGLLAAFVAIQAVALSLAWGLETLALNSLYTLVTPTSVSLSASRVDSDKLRRIVETASNDDRVRALIAASGGGGVTFNYVMPDAWCVPEVPMGACDGHDQPANYDANLYKVVVTRPVMRSPEFADAADFIRKVKTREPLAIVRVDVPHAKVLDVAGPAPGSFYEGIPVAIY